MSRIESEAAIQWGGTPVQTRNTDVTQIWYTHGMPTGQLTAAKVVRCKIGKQVFGPVSVSELRKFPGFTLQTPVFAEGMKTWEPAFQAIDLDLYFGRTLAKSAKPISPFRPSSSEGLDPALQNALNKLSSAKEHMESRLQPVEWPVAQLKRAGRTFTMYLMIVSVLTATGAFAYEGRGELLHFWVGARSAFHALPVKALFAHGVAPLMRHIPLIAAPIVRHERVEAPALKVIPKPHITHTHHKKLHIHPRKKPARIQSATAPTPAPAHPRTPFEFQRIQE